MEGLMTEPTPEAPPARAQRVLNAQNYDTAMRKVRLSMPVEEWKALQATETRHYKTGRPLLTLPASAHAAWAHATDASPWVLPAFDMAAALTAAYTTGYATTADMHAGRVGARELSTLKALRVVPIATIGQVEAWLQRVGPCVLGGDWGRGMIAVARDTETVGPRTGAAFQHAVALIGLKPGYVRLANNAGVAWGALGRAWMSSETVASILGDGGEAWGVVPVDLVRKGAK
jgi:hypothetical protein